MVFLPYWVDGDEIEVLDLFHIHYWKVFMVSALPRLRSENIVYQISVLGKPLPLSKRGSLLSVLSSCARLTHTSERK